MLQPTIAVRSLGQTDGMHDKEYYQHGRQQSHLAAASQSPNDGHDVCSVLYSPSFMKGVSNIQQWPCIIQTSYKDARCTRAPTRILRAARAVLWAGGCDTRMMTQQLQPLD